MPTGLGDEELWLSPTVANNVNPFDDQSGNGNNGTGQGGVSTISDTGAGGSYCYDFDGVNDYISTSFSPNTSSYDFVSFSAWIEIDNQTSVVFPILADRNGGTTGWVNFALLVNGAALSHWAYIPNSAYVLSLAQSSGSWLHLAQVRDKANKQLHVYANGVFVGTSTHTGSTTHTGQTFSLGMWDNGASGGGSARLDDIRYYERALTQAEITHLATSRGVLGPPGGAANYNPFRNAKYINKTYQIPRFG